MLQLTLQPLNCTLQNEGSHGYRVVERLVELGFSKKELLVLKFTESDIDRALQEGEEYV